MEYMAPAKAFAEPERDLRARFHLQRQLQLVERGLLFKVQTEIGTVVIDGQTRAVAWSDALAARPRSSAPRNRTISRAALAASDVRRRAMK